MCQLKVKVAVKGQILNKQILDIMLCQLCKSYTNGKKSLILAQLKVKVTVKGQIFNKQIVHIMSCPLYNFFTNGRISFKLEWHIHLN